LLTGMSILGQVLLVVIFLLCGFSVVFALRALKLKTEAAKTAVDWAKVAMLTAAGLSVVVLVLLVIAFLTDGFSVDVVRQYSATDLPVCYKLSALWAGSTGSLLLWSVGVFIAFAFWLKTNADGRLAFGNLKFDAIVLSIGASVCLIFTALLIFFAKPFAAGSAPVYDGVGLNPLLRNFWIFIRQPLLFTAYSVFLIPFVVVLSAVFVGGAGDLEVYKKLRRWLLVGICFLVAGIAAGARWSYVKLGQGSFWSWDPVENILLLLCFVGLAALHSLVGVRIADKFRFWTIILAPLLFILCLFITFIIESGILISLYSVRGTVSSLALLVFIGYCFLLWLIGIIWTVKRESVRSLRTGGFRLDKMKGLFWADVIFIFAATVIVVATFWPVIWQSVAESDSAVTISPLFYDRIILVAAIILVFLIGFVTLVDLREHRGFIAQFLGCCAAGVLCFGLILRLGRAPLLLTLTCGICAFSFAAVLIKLALSLKQISKIASGIAHLGLLLLVFAAGFSSDRLNVQTALDEKGQLELGKYKLFYESFKQESFAGVTKEGPEIVLTKEKLRRKLWPHQCLYPNGRRADEAAVHMGLFEDVYVSFNRLSRVGSAIITVRVKPFMFWLWFAAGLIVAGLALSLFGKKP
jgi:cytochrome c-type biogenesis protein CcmF